MIVFPRSRSLLCFVAAAALGGPVAARAEVAARDSAVDAAADLALQRGAPPAAKTDAEPEAAPTATARDGGFFTRLTRYYASEMGKTGPEADPDAPPSRRDDFPPQPVTQPPYPFTEWPYGASTALGVTRPNSVDSPLMAALAPTSLGEAMKKAHIQVYGWGNVGFNVSSNGKQGGNAPGAYNYDPNTIQLDQFVLYAERLPDTVQRDHVDWGFRVSTIYGVDYRYTTSYGLESQQLLQHNRTHGYDFPMLYGELYFPQVAKGLLVRVGRYISIPDIEAQLAPNNYMYSHSMTYTFDNYTNTGVVFSMQANKNITLQAGVVIGTDTAIWNWGKKVNNPYPNPLYPGTRFLKDPGAKPSFVGCFRYQSDSGRDDFYACADGINNGVWGYNNLQWLGFTYYHKFTDKFHVAFETYNVHENNVPNVNNPVALQAYLNGGTPFSPQRIPFNAPGLAQCDSTTSLTCTINVQTYLTYWNYRFTPLDNLSFRAEYFDDMQGQRTGVKTAYAAFALGVQHWLSPQITFRPEIAYYRALDAKAFNGNSNYGGVPSRQNSLVLSGDVIFHF